MVTFLSLISISELVCCIFTRGKHIKSVPIRKIKLISKNKEHKSIFKSVYCIKLILSIFCALLGVNVVL